MGLPLVVRTKMSLECALFDISPPLRGLPSRSCLYLPLLRLIPTPAGSAMYKKSRRSARSVDPRPYGACIPSLNVQRKAVG